MAPLGAHQCGLHAADAAADDGDVLGLAGRLDVVLFGLHGLGVDGTAGQTHSVGQILGVVMSLGGGEVEAAAVAADAGADVLQTILDQLSDPFRVGKELAGNAHAVDAALGDGLCRHVGLHTTGAHHGNVHKLLDMCHVIQIAVLGHIHGGMCPVPGVVGAVVGVEHIIAGILQVFGGSLRLCHGAALLGGGIAGHQTFGKALQLGLHAVTQRNGEVLAAAFLDGANYLGGKAVAVFKAAAVLVGALVEKLDGELIQQITFVNSVHFHAVYTGILAQLGGFGKGLDDLVDLLHRDLGADDVGCPTGGLGAGRGQFVRGVQNGLHDGTGDLIFVQRANQLGDGPGTSHAGGQLDEQLGTGFVDLLHEFLQILEHLGVLPQPFAPEGIPQRGDAGDDQTHVVVGPLQKQLCGLFVEFTAGQLKPAEQGSAAHGAHDDTVFDFYIAHLPRGEKGFIFCVHSASPL